MSLLRGFILCSQLWIFLPGIQGLPSGLIPQGQFRRSPKAGPGTLAGALLGFHSDISYRGLTSAKRLSRDREALSSWLNDAVNHHHLQRRGWSAKNESLVISDAFLTTANILLHLGDRGSNQRRKCVYHWHIFKIVFFGKRSFTTLVQTSKGTKRGGGEWAFLLSLTCAMPSHPHRALSIGTRCRDRLLQRHCMHTHTFALFIKLFLAHKWQATMCTILSLIPSSA